MLVCVCVCTRVSVWFLRSPFLEFRCFQLLSCEYCLVHCVFCFPSSTRSFFSLFSFPVNLNVYLYLIVIGCWYCAFVLLQIAAFISVFTGGLFIFFPFFLIRIFEFPLFMILVGICVLSRVDQNR